MALVGSGTARMSKDFAAAAKNAMTMRPIQPPPSVAAREEGEIGMLLRQIDSRIDEIQASHERLEARLTSILSTGPDAPGEPEPTVSTPFAANLQSMLRRLTGIYYHTQNMIDRTAL
jgi:hypothetical protein